MRCAASDKLLAFVSTNLPHTVHRESIRFQGKQLNETTCPMLALRTTADVLNHTIQPPQGLTNDLHWSTGCQFSQRETMYHVNVFGTMSLLALLGVLPTWASSVEVYAFT